MWDDIADITGVHDILSEADMLLDDTTHVCLLNENYRNTLQITEFCNKEFEANVTAVGIAGDPVQEMQLAAAVQWLWSLKHKNKELRVVQTGQQGFPCTDGCTPANNNCLLGYSRYRQDVYSSC